MLISHILKHKGSEVVTIDGDATVIALATLFGHRRIAAAVVVEDDRIVGLASERDVVAEVAVHREKALAMRVRDVMTTSPVICKPDDTTKGVMKLMTYRRVRHLPVVEDGALRGIVSIGDIVKAQLDETRLEMDVLRDYARVHVA